MSSITPSPPYMPPQNREVKPLHRQGGGNKHPHHHTPSPTSYHNLHHPHHHQLPPHTPHSTLQSSVSSTSTGRGGRASSSSGGNSKSHLIGGRLNLSAHSSKNSVGGNSGSVSPGTTGTGTRTTGLDQSRDNSHLTDISHISQLAHKTTPIPPHLPHPSLLLHPSSLTHQSNTSSLTNNTLNSQHNYGHSNGVLPNKSNILHTSSILSPKFIHQVRRTNSSSKGLLQTLGLLCLVSLLLAILALYFLLKLTPSPSDHRGVPSEEFGRDVIQDVTLAIAALTLSLNLFCVLVCAAQFIFAIKLTKASANGEDRAAQYLSQSSVSRACAITGFFVSVPLLLGGVVVHTFLVLHSLSAILTSAFIGVGIVLCGAAMIHNVLLWQKHKRRSRQQSNIHQSMLSGHTHQMKGSRHRTPHHHLHSTSSPMPPTTVDLSATLNGTPHELSTLV